MNLIGMNEIDDSENDDHENDSPVLEGSRLQAMQNTHVNFSNNHNEETANSIPIV